MDKKNNIMNNQDIINQCISLYNTLLKGRNRELMVRSDNQKACDEILKELDYQTTEYVAQILFYIRNLIPVSGVLVDKVSETASDDELKVLRKHGIKIFRK